MTNNITAEEIYKQWNDTYYLEGNNGGIQKHKRYVIEMMQEYARIKCLEAIKNTKYKSCDIVLNDTSITTTDACEKKIMNIHNQDVMPEL